MLRSSLLTIATGVFGVAMAIAPAQAQSSGNNKVANSKADEVSIGQDMTVTGCLTKDQKEKNEFLITGEDGRTWGLKSSSLKLSDHLNHKVTVTGKVTKKEHEQKEAGDLKVSNLTMISTNCQ
jgi:hypothetical protein